MKVYVAGLGQISPVGQGMASLKSALQTRSIPEVYKVPEVNMPNTLPESVKRRMSRISKMFFASVSEAIEDSKINLRGPGTGLVIGSAFCSLDLAIALERKYILEGPPGVSPTLFAGSVQNSVASHLSISFGIEGPCSTVVSMERTTEGALRLAYDWITQSVVDHVIVAVGDEVSEFHTYAGPRGNLPLGEGVAAFVLSHTGTREFHPSQLRELGSPNAAFYGEMVTGQAIEAAIAFSKTI